MIPWLALLCLSSSSSEVIMFHLQQTVNAEYWLSCAKMMLNYFLNENFHMVHLVHPSLQSTNDLMALKCTQKL